MNKKIKKLNKNKGNNPSSTYDNNMIDNEELQNKHQSDVNSSKLVSPDKADQPAHTSNQTLTSETKDPSLSSQSKNMKKGKKKNKKRKGSEGNRNGTSESIEKYGDGNSVKQSGDGTLVGADNFQNNASNATGKTANVGGNTDKFISLVGYGVNGSNAFNPIQYDRVDHNLSDPSSMANNLINYSRSKNETYSLKNILGIRKKQLILTNPTVPLGIQQEEYDLNRDYYSMYFLNPFGEEIRKLSMPIGLPVTAINYVIGFNVSGHFPSYNPFLKSIKKIVDDGVTDFTYIEDNSKNLFYLGKEIKLLANQANAAESIRQGSSQKHLIGGMKPEVNGKVSFKLLEHKVEYNNKRIKKFGTDVTINDNLVTDCGTWRVSHSDKQFIENFVNAVLNDPSFSKVAGLTKHVRVLLHAHSTLVQFGTISRIMIMCIEGALNAMPFIGQKLGKLDTTIKYFATSPINKDLRNNINRFIAVVSKFPFNKKVTDDFISKSGIYLFNDKDPSHIHNPMVSVSNVISGNFTNFEYYEDPFMTHNVRDNMASPSVPIPIGPLAKALFPESFRYMDPSMGYDKKSEFDASQHYFNVNNNVAESVRRKDLDKSAEVYVLNINRMTSIFLNQIKELFTGSEFITKLEQYSSRVSLFLSIYSSDKILSSTDYAMEVLSPLDWFTIKEIKPAVFPDKSLFTSLNLGSYYSKIDLVLPKQLENFSYMPKWNLFLPYGNDKINYQNMLGYLVTSINNKEDEKDIPNKPVKMSQYKDQEINAKLYQVNFLDATYLPLIADLKHIILGWNDGVIAHGERYKFDSGVSDQADYLTWGCSVFEYTIPNHPTLIKDSVEPSTNLTANAPDGGYFVSQTLSSFAGLARSDVGASQIHNDLGTNEFPNHCYVTGNSSSNISYWSVPIWKVSVPQRFRNDIFKGLSAMSGGVPYAELPTLKMCDLLPDNS